MKTRLVIIIPTVFVLVILAVIAYDSITLDKLCVESGGMRNGDICIIQESGESIPEQIESVNFDNIFTMKPDSMELFYYPNSAKEKDTYRLFMLIRLPEWMGGAANDTSAFRAYSAKALDDPCIIKYWPGYERQRIENPCQGGMYRVIDGALTYGGTPRTTALTALPYLDLSMDEYGMMYVEPPQWTLFENGVLGYGRMISLDEIRNNSAFLVESFAKYYPKYPPIPVRFAGYFLAEISAEGYDATVRYLDFPNKSGSIKMEIGRLSGGLMYPNPAKSNFEFWQIGDTVIRIGGSAFDENSSTHESFRTNVIEFPNGIGYKIEGKNLEFMKKEIVANFFPEYEYDDLFLVSSTVGK